METKNTNTAATNVAITGLLIISVLFVLAMFKSSNNLHNHCRLVLGLEPESIIEQLF